MTSPEYNEPRPDHNALHARVNGSDIIVTIEAISPERAQVLLSHNTHNRRVRANKVTSYALDMINGDWRFTGEAITIDCNGVIADGQHRLHAIVKSDITIMVLVVRGITPEAQENTDRGIPRRFHDVLALREVSNSQIVAAILRLATAWEDGRRRHVSTFSPSDAAMNRVLADNPEIIEMATIAARLSRLTPLPASLIGFMYWLFKSIDAEDASFFFERLADGQGLVKGNPIYELRRTLDQAKTAHTAHARTWLLAITIKGWNAYRNGETVSLYKWRLGGANPENFPEPI